MEKVFDLLLFYFSYMKFTSIYFCFFWSIISFGQNTVGTILLNESLAQDGYTIYTPNKQSTSYLIDNCGQIVHKWLDNPMAGIGADQYVLEDGSLLIAKFDIDITSEPSIGAGGSGGIIEIRSWDNDLKWRYIIRDSLQMQHHDIHMMPNGNILAISYDRHFLEDIVSMGFDTSAYNQTELWPDKIIEIDTSTNEIVWEWRAWDHMIQDFDSSKSNFGVVSDNPQLIDVNYQDFSFGRQDWMHSNSIDYNEELDQILISVRNFQEVWIIDHSTTTEEAASHNGGNTNRGGDLLFRWGNDHAYKKGTTENRHFFYQHDASWLDEPFHSSSEYFNMISVYNNFINSEYSLGAIIDPIFSDNIYSLEDGVFLPNDIFHTVSHPDTAKQRSGAASNFQLLPNGNFLLHAGRQGRTMELTPDEEPVWEYLVPMRNGVAVDQGEILGLSDNFTFTGRKYASDYNGFEGKDLSSQGFIELLPSDLFCNPLSANDAELNSRFILFPNPTSESITVSSLKTESAIRIYDVHGNRVFQSINISGQTELDVSHLTNGIYYLECDGSFQSFIKN